MSRSNPLTLKQASKLSGYSPDYIGYLIRSGKIKGKKAYCQITWQTTEAELFKYQTSQKDQGTRQNIIKKINSALNAYSTRVKSEISLMFNLLSHFKALIPIFFMLLLCLVVITFFTLDSIFNRDIMTIVNKDNSAPNQISSVYPKF